MEYPFLLAFLLYAAPIGEARAKEMATELVNAALAAFDSGDYATAAARYLEAYEVATAHGLPPKPELLYNAGLAFDLAGRCDRAADLLERFASTPIPEPPKDLAERLERARSCAPLVLIETTPPQATVLVDGEDRGRTPIELHLLPGERRLRFELAGHLALEETWTVPLNGMEKQARALQPAETRQEVELHATTTTAILPGKPPPSELSTWAWVSGGVGAGGVIGGITLAILANGAVGRRDAELAKPEDVISGRRVRESHDEAVRLSIGSYVAFSVAIAGAATAIVLLLLDSEMEL